MPPSRATASRGRSPPVAGKRYQLDTLPTGRWLCSARAARFEPPSPRSSALRLDLALRRHRHRAPHRSHRRSGSQREGKPTGSPLAGGGGQRETGLLPLRLHGRGERQSRYQAFFFEIGEGQRTHPSETADQLMASAAFLLARLQYLEYVVCGCRWPGGSCSKLG